MRNILKIFFVAVIVLIVIFSLKHSKRSTPDLSNSLMAKELQSALAGGKPVVLEFYSDGWGACVDMKPVVNGLKDEYNGKVVFLIVDIGSGRDNALADQYDIRAIPTFKVFDKKGVLQDTIIGADEPKLKELMAKFANE